MEEENFSLRWNDFEENISAGLQDLRKSNNFFDVTLLSDGGQVGAHKLILSACSSFFRKILVTNPHQHPLIYLKGVSKEEIVNLLNFMYCGEVNIAQAELSSFLAAAEDLKVKGLTNSGKSEHSAVRDTVAPDIKAKKTSKLPRTSDDIIAEEVSMLDVVQVKSEPVAAMTGVVAEKALAAPDYEVDSGEFQYDDYQAQDTGFEDDFSNNILSPSKALDVDGSGDNVYPCNICGRTFNSSSHCNRHCLTVHGTTVPVQCEVCGKSFKNQDSCNTHMRKFHDIYSNSNRRREANQDFSWPQI